MDGEWYADPPEPQVDVADDEPVGTILGPSGDIVRQVYVERPRFGFQPSPAAEPPAARKKKPRKKRRQKR